MILLWARRMQKIWWTMLCSEQRFWSSSTTTKTVLTKGSLQNQRYLFKQLNCRPYKLNIISLYYTQLLEAIDRGRYGGGPRGRFWTLDPIDGTKGFLRGEQYAICLALVEDGHVQFGVVGCPNLLTNLSDPDSDRGCLLFASRGHGAYQVKKKKRVEAYVLYMK